MSKNTHQQLARISELDTAIDAAADKGDDAFFAAVAAKDEYIDSQGIDRDRLEVTGREAQGNVSNYIERPHQVQYVIHSLSESDVDLDGAVGAFWSNEDGWGSLQSATLFSTKERMSLNLPMSAKLDAEWMLAEEARDLDANRNPQGNVTELAKYVADFERGLIASRGAINDANFDQKRLAASKDAIASGSDHDLKECLIWWTEAIASGLLFHVQGNVEHATHNRYALAVQDAEAGLIWSVGGVWSASLLSQSPALMTGPEVDALHKKHPNAHIVDVIVYREACEAYNAGFNAVLNHDERSTPESRQAARNAGIESLVRAGFPENALEIGRNDYLQQGNVAKLTEQVAPATKLVEVRLSALTRVEYMEVVEVPANITQAELDDLVNARYRQVDGGEFTSDPEYWERGTCEAIDSDMPDATPTMMAFRTEHGLHIERADAAAQHISGAGRAS